MPRGAKECPACHQSCGPKSKVCPNAACKHVFQFKTAKTSSTAASPPGINEVGVNGAVVMPQPLAKPIQVAVQTATPKTGRAYGLIHAHAVKPGDPNFCPVNYKDFLDEANANWEDAVLNWVTSLRDMTTVIDSKPFKFARSAVMKFAEHNWPRYFKHTNPDGTEVVIENPDFVRAREIILNNMLQYSDE